MIGSGNGKAFVAGYMGTAIVLAGRGGRMPFLMYLAACVLGGKAAQLGWQIAEDVHNLAEQANDRAWAAETAPEAASAD